MIANQRTNLRVLLLVVAVGLAIAVGLLVWRAVPGFQNTADNVVIGHATYVIDHTDDKELVGFASDVLFGRVTESLGQVFPEGSSNPRSLFNVEVMEVLKGSLSDTVKVGQAGGVFKDGTPYRMMDDPDLLEPGKVYLLVMKGPAPKRNGGGYLILSAGYGKYEILEGTGGTPGPTGNTGSGETSEGEDNTGSGPGDTSGEPGPTGNTDGPEILDTPQANDLRARFADAIENEIPFDFGE